MLNKETGEYEPLDVNATYNLAGYNYTLRDLGDGYAMFAGAVNVLDYVMEDYMVLASYVKSFEGGKVTGYAEPKGRITIVSPPPQPMWSWPATASGTLPLRLWAAAPSGAPSMRPTRTPSRTPA